MKLTNSISKNKFIIGLLIIFSVLIIENSAMRIAVAEENKNTINTVGENVISIANNAEKLKKKKKATLLKHSSSNAKANRVAKSRVASESHADPAPAAASSNTSRISAPIYQNLNDTFVIQEVKDFKDQMRKWDYKLLDKQLEDVFRTMNLRDNVLNTEYGDRGYLQFFLTQFEACDKSGDNVLDYSEFETCMKNDTYLNKITPPPAIYSALVNYTNATFFYQKIFQVLDTYHTNYTNFYDYMNLRLYIYSWKRCSVLAPFIEETSFECALETVAGFKTSSRTTLRNIYYMGLELSNSQNIRTLDFITYLMIAQSARIYGKINQKEDSDLSKAEFNLALDENMLPTRYNQDVVNAFFDLIHEDDKHFQGIDYQSFIYYDFALRIFDIPQTQRRWFVNVNGFNQVLNDIIFPNKTLQEIVQIPMCNYSAASYQMFTYLNLSTFNDEHDYFVKFLETKENTAEKKTDTYTQNRNKQIFNLASILPANVTSIGNDIFEMIDFNSDGWINWKDFGQFFQISYLFSRFDPFQKGRLTAGDLYEKFIDYSDFPRISHIMRTRAKRFNLFNQDIYIDLFTALRILTIEDIIQLYVRRSDKSTLYEVELKRVFAKLKLRYVPDGHLNKCLRGTDNNHIPLYDWECAFIIGVRDNVHYTESAASFNTMRAQNLTVVNTVFTNVDPSLTTPVAAPAKA